MINAGNNHWSYDMLKMLIEEEVTSFSILEELKDMFASEIGSVRRLECIRSIKDLIDCLERRDIICEYNIDGLRDIADNTENPKLHSAVASYITPKEITSTEPKNIYQECRLAEELQRCMNVSQNNAPQLCNGASCVRTPPSANSVNFCEKKRSAVYKLISRNIGSYWRSFGREMGLGEGDMDAVELQFPNDLSSRIYKIIQLFEEESEFLSDSEKVLRICGALDECGRKDLRRKMEAIMSSR